ncbi:MAG: hypothetical protein ACRD10_01700 [Terriglobia bacterium]
MKPAKPVSIIRLILIPALITLAVTILRLVGELQHWPRPWFDSAAGGGGALVGISWLPIIFGPYFAVKLAGAAEGPSSTGKAGGFSVLGLIVFVAGAFVLASTFSHASAALAIVGFLVMLAAAFVPRVAWRSLGNVLFAYAFAARIPVLVVMFFAMRGNGGAGWGTHYDAAGPLFAHASFGRKFLFEAILPQMTLWIGFTVVVGSLLGAIVTAVRFRRRTAQAAV